MTMARKRKNTRIKKESGCDELTAALIMEADRGVRNAQCSLGLCYMHGEGVERDLKEAVRYYRLAADQGHVVAQFYLGNS